MRDNTTNANQRVSKGIPPMDRATAPRSAMPYRALSYAIEEGKIGTSEVEVNSFVQGWDAVGSYHRAWQNVHRTGQATMAVSVAAIVMGAMAAGLYVMAWQMDGELRPFAWLLLLVGLILGFIGIEGARRSMRNSKAAMAAFHDRWLGIPVDGHEDLS